MIPGLLVLLGCQLLGTVFVTLVDAPVPGPVVGMVLLLGWLQLRRPSADHPVPRAAGALLRHLQLLFVPAGVGVVQYLSLLGASAVPVVVGLAVSWFAALASTAAVAAGLLALQRRTSRGAA